jgi:hypothetical protein
LPGSRQNVDLTKAPLLRNTLLAQIVTEECP